MIYDYRDGNNALLPPIGMVDAATMLPLTVFYYDTETHLVERHATDFDGSLLMSVRRDDPRFSRAVDFLEIWETRELYLIQRASVPESQLTARQLPASHFRFVNHMDRHHGEIPEATT